MADPMDKKKRKWEDQPAGSAAALATSFLPNALAGINPLAMAGLMPGMFPGFDASASITAALAAQEVAAKAAAAQAAAQAVAAAMTMQTAAPPVTPNLDVAKQMAGEQIQKINEELAKKGIGLKPRRKYPEVPDSKRNKDPGPDDVYREVVINDCQGHARANLTRKATQDDIRRKSGAVVTTRGRFYAPGEPMTSEKPLYLYIVPAVDALDPPAKIAAVERAVNLILDLMGPGPWQDFRPHPIVAAPPPQHIMGGPPSYGPPGGPPGPYGAPPGAGYHGPPPTGAGPVLVAAPAALKGEGPSPFSESPAPGVLLVYAGFEADSTFNTAEKIRGPSNQFIAHIAAHTKSSILLRGRGSGSFEVQGQELNAPLHLEIQNADPLRLEEARGLAESLMQTVVAEYLEFVRSSSLNGAAPPQAPNTAAPYGGPAPYAYPSVPSLGAPKAKGSRWDTKGEGQAAGAAAGAPQHQQQPQQQQHYQQQQHQQQQGSKAGPGYASYGGLYSQVAAAASKQAEGRRKFREAPASSPAAPLATKSTGTSPAGAAAAAAAAAAPSAAATVQAGSTAPVAPSTASAGTGPTAAAAAAAAEQRSASLASASVGPELTAQGQHSGTQLAMEHSQRAAAAAAPTAAAPTAAAAAAAAAAGPRVQAPSSASPPPASRLHPSLAGLTGSAVSEAELMPPPKFAPSRMSKGRQEQPSEKEEESGGAAEEEGTEPGLKLVDYGEEEE